MTDMTNRDAAWILEHIETHNGIAEDAKQMAIRVLKATYIEGEIIEDGYEGVPSVCSNCGADVKRFHRYCWYCGIKFRQESKT